MQVQSDLDHARNGKLPFYRRSCIARSRTPASIREKAVSTVERRPIRGIVQVPRFRRHPGHVSAVGKIDAASKRPARVDRTRYEDVGHGIQVPVTKWAGPQVPKLIAHIVLIALFTGVALVLV
jgi:hypothetical protein